MQKRISAWIWTLLFTGVLFVFLLPTPKGIFAHADNPYGWEKMGAYTTYYSKEERDRCQNIFIAASLIDGVTLQAYGEFSFNATVGKRTEEAGFRQAKIIVNGEYVVGVGGGVSVTGGVNTATVGTGVAAVSVSGSPSSMETTVRISRSSVSRAMAASFGSE
jgi:hypothetical protein